MWFSRVQGKKKKVSGEKVIACIGGGTGLFSLLSGLKGYVRGNENIKAIVTTLDNGGSSGRLITQYGMLPPGDIRNCLVALSESGETFSDLFQYRFDESIGKHNFGNLLLTALTDIKGSFEEAVKEASRILRVKGEVIPVSLENNDLEAVFEDGSEITGESEITDAGKRISEVRLGRNTSANKRAADVLGRADIIVLGPGSLYTSIIPNLLFTEVREAIKANKRADKVLVPSVMSQPGETDNFCVSDFKREVEKYMEKELDYILANSHIPPTVALHEYQKESKSPIIVDSNNIEGSRLVKGNFIDEDMIVRHNPRKIAGAVLKILREER